MPWSEWWWWLSSSSSSDGGEPWLSFELRAWSAGVAKTVWVITVERLVRAVRAEASLSAQSRSHIELDEGRHAVSTPSREEAGVRPMLGCSAAAEPSHECVGASLFGAPQPFHCATPPRQGECGSEILKSVLEPTNGFTQREEVLLV